MRTYEIIGALAVDSELDTVIVDGDERVLSCDVHALSECFLIEAPSGERYISASCFNEDHKVIKKVNVICAHDYWPPEDRVEWED